MRVKKGDSILVLAGEHKGQTGKVLYVDTLKSAVLVEGVNMKKKHQRPSQKSPKGGVVSMEMPIHISNVSLYVNIDGKPKPTRISRKIIDDGGHKTKLRISRLTGEEI